MKPKSQHCKIAILISTLCFAKFSIAESPNLTNSSQSRQTQQITIRNQSAITLMPTAEGLSEGCIGGSLPPFFQPIAPYSTRVVNLIFIQYLPTCRFDVLPVPNILSYLQACHGAKANDTLTYTGTTFASLHCQINNSKSHRET